jgi:hypothetical protein
MATRASSRIVNARRFAPTLLAISGADKGREDRRVKRSSSAPVSKMRHSMKFRAKLKIVSGLEFCITSPLAIWIYRRGPEDKLRFFCDGAIF